MKQKIVLGRYPYTYARVSVMRASILTKDDYHKLLKMSLNEIISYLQSSEYKKAIDELGIKYAGVELMEMALSKNLVDTWNKLKKISSKEVRIMISAYLARADLWNIKTILRGLHTNTRLETIVSELLPVGQLSNEQLELLLKSESIEDFLKKLGVLKIKFEALSSALETLKTKNTIVELENFFDKEYHRRLMEFTKTIPSEGKLFKQFLDAEIDTTNIISILRLKKAGLNKQNIQSYIIGSLSLFADKLLRSDNKEETSKLLSEKVTDTAITEFEKTNSLVDIEIDLEKKLLGKTRLLLHQHPLTVSVILGYMFAKEIEVKNLKMMLKSRQLNLSEEFIEQQIIV